MATDAEKAKAFDAKEETIRVTPHTSFADGGTYKRDVAYDVPKSFANRNARFLNAGESGEKGGKLKPYEADAADPDALPDAGGAGQPTERVVGRHAVAAETRLAVEAGYPEAGGSKKAASKKSEK